MTSTETAKWDAHDSALEPLTLSEEILQGIRDWYPTPLLPLQYAAIAKISQGKDVMVQTRTELHETHISVLSGLKQLDQECDSAQVLILCPTRELANCVKTVTSVIGAHVGVKSHLCGFDKLDDSPNRSQFLLGSPGCILNLVLHSSLTLDRLKLLIINQVDEQVERRLSDHIVDLHRRLPARIQVAMTCVSISTGVEDLARTIMTQPVTLLPDHYKTPIDKLRQYYVKLETGDDKGEVLNDLLDEIPNEKVLVLCPTAEDELNLSGDAESPQTHGKATHNIPKSKTQVTILSKIKDYEGGPPPRILIVFDVPSSHLEYEETIVPFGRMRMDGIVINLVEDHPQRATLWTIESLYGIPIKELPMDVRSIFIHRTRLETTSQ